MRRTGRAVWNGDVYEGHGSMTTDSGVLNGTPYSLTTRTEDDSGTSPEELLATAHAGCFNMGLSFILGKHGYTPDRLETNATISFDMAEEGLRINRAKLDLVAVIPGIERTTFMELAAEASRSCTISAVLKARVTVNFRLVS